MREECQGKSEVKDKVEDEVEGGAVCEMRRLSVGILGQDTRQLMWMTSNASRSFSRLFYIIYLTLFLSDSFRPFFLRGQLQRSEHE